MDIEVVDASWARRRSKWLARAARVELAATLRDDRETYRRAAGLLARMYRRFPLRTVATSAAEMAGRHAELQAR